MNKLEQSILSHFVWSKNGTICPMFQQGAVGALCIAGGGTNGLACSHRRNLEVWHTEAALHIKMTEQLLVCKALGVY